MEYLPLQHFDLSRVKEDSVCIITGKRATGKTSLVKTLMRNRNGPYYRMIVGDDYEYSELGAKNALLTNEYFPNIPQIVKSRQVDLCREGQSSVLVLDDCIFRKEDFFHKDMLYLFENHQNLRLQIIIAMGYPMEIPPRAIYCVDYVFIFGRNSNSTIAKLYEQYGSAFESLEHFQQILDLVQDRYDALVIDNTTPSSRIEDIVFYLPKAQP